MQKTSLPGGGVLLYEPTDKFKSDYFTLNFLSPLTAELATAYSLLFSVLCRGSAGHPTQQSISRRCDELYALALSAGTSKFGEKLGLTYALSSVSDAYSFDGTQILREGMKLLGEIATDPYLPDGSFLPEYLAQEKRNLHDRLRSKIDNKSAYAVRRAVALMCEGEPYAVSSDGEEALIDGTGDALLASCLDTLRTKLLPVVTYVGSAGIDTVRRCFAESFPLSGGELDLSRPIRTGTSSGLREITETMDVTQCKLVLGYRMSKTLFDRDYVKFALFNEILGGSPTSKLFLNVREKRSLCYYCRPMPAAVKGVFLISCGIDKKNKSAATEAILEQIEDMRLGRFTQREFEDGKRSLINAYREIQDGASSVSDWYFARFLAGRDDSPEEAAKAVESVSAADVAEMADTLTPEIRYVLEG